MFVELDRYDEEAFARALEALPDASELRARGARLLPHFDALLADLFGALFKLVVRPPPGASPPASAGLVRRVFAGVVASPGFGPLKKMTALDAPRAMAAAAGICRKLLARLKQGELLDEHELLAAHELAREEERLAQARALRDDLPPGARARERVDRVIQRGEARVKEPGAELARALDQIPPGLEAEVEREAEVQAAQAHETEAAIQSWAHAVGGEAPAGAEARLALAERLRKDPRLARLAAVAGAFRSFALAVCKKKRMSRAPEETYSVTLGRDLARLLPGELGGLRDHHRRKDFQRRFVEGQLAQYDLRGVDQGGRGPLVICIDGSGSMRGAKEMWAKAVALAVCEIARRQDRAARAIVFADPDAPLETFDLLSRRRRAAGGRRAPDVQKAVELAACFSGGGTDFERPLLAAAEALCESRLRGGDILFITDGEASIRPEVAARLRGLKEKLDFAVYGVVVDVGGPAGPAGGAANAARTLSSVADKVTTVSRLTAAAVEEIFLRL